MYDGNTGKPGFARIGKINFPAIKENLTAVFCVDTGYDFHQCRFTGAVFAHKSMDFAA